MKIEVPESVGSILVAMLAGSKEVGAILTAFQAGKGVEGPITLYGSFTIEVPDPVTEKEKESGVL